MSDFTYTRTGDVSVVKFDDGYECAWKVDHAELLDRYRVMFPEDRLAALKEELVTRAKWIHSIATKKKQNEPE